MAREMFSPLALRAPALTDEARPGPGDLAGQLLDAGRGNPGDARGPCRSLWRLVRALPQNVGFVGRTGWSALGQGFLIIADGVFGEEGLVDKVFGDHHVGQRRAEGRVRTRADGNPFVAHGHHGIGITRIDDDDAGVTGETGVLERFGLAPRHARFRGVVAEEHGQFAVFHVGKRVPVNPAPAVQIGHTYRDLAGGVVRIVVQVTTHEIHEPGYGRGGRRPAFAHGAAEGTRAVVEIDGLVAVGVYGAAQPLSDLLEGFLPADTFEFAFSSVAHSAQGIGDALFGIDALTHGAPARTSTELLHTVAVVSGVVRLYAGDHAVFDVHPQGATAAAVDVAGVPEDALFPCPRGGGRCGDGASRIEDFNGKRKECRSEDDGAALDHVAPFEQCLLGTMRFPHEPSAEKGFRSRNVPMGRDSRNRQACSIPHRKGGCQ